MNKGKIVIGSLILVLIAVIAYVVMQLRKITKSPMTYVSAKLNSLSFSKIDLTAYFKLVNTGNAMVTVSGQEYDVYLNGKFVSHMKYSNPVVIGPGENIIPLDVSIGFSDVLKAGWTNLGDILTDKSKVNISLKGKLSIKISAIQIKNVEINETFNLGEMGKNNPESSYMVTGCPPGMLPDPTTGICSKNNVQW